MQFRIVVDCVSGFNRWLTCAREALVRVSAPLLTVAIKPGGTCNSAIRSPTRPWSFPLNIFFRNRNYPFLFFLFFLSNASESSSRNESTRSKIDFLFRGLTYREQQFNADGVKDQWKSVVERANEILFFIECWRNYFADGVRPVGYLPSRNGRTNRKLRVPSSRNWKPFIAGKMFAKHMISRIFDCKLFLRDFQLHLKRNNPSNVFFSLSREWDVCKMKVENAIRLEIQRERKR